MQLSALTDTSTSTDSAALSSSQSVQDDSRTSVDFQNFLQLLTTQLRNQDPLSPLDSTEFVAQLASFSTVEQLVNANTRLDSIASSIVNDAIDQYAGLIGREVEVVNPEIAYNGAPVSFRISGQPEADAVEIVVKDETGRERARFAGENSDVVQQWSGEGLPIGRYRIHAEYKSEGTPTGIEEATTFGVISEIRLTNDGAELRLEGGVGVRPEKLVGISAQKN